MKVKNLKTKPLAEQTSATLHPRVAGLAAVALGGVARAISSETARPSQP